MLGFESTRNQEDFENVSLSLISSKLDNKQVKRYKKIKRAWNFYEGYHWEDLEEQDGAELTINFCKAFVNKFVSFELGKAFTFAVHEVPKVVTPQDVEEDNHLLDVENIQPIVSADGRTLFKYLEDVWEDNNQYQFCNDMGQMKSVTGEAWVQVHFQTLEDLEGCDPFGKYPNGRVKIMLMPTETVWAEYDPHDRDKLVKVTVMYTYKKTSHSAILGVRREAEVIYTQVWTKDKCVVTDGDAEPEEFDNKYGIIPFVHIKNLTIAGRSDGYGDLDDVIPINIEYNLKTSDVSEIIDYHAAPTTIVYGAKIGNLEKGANKMWGGLAKDARVENLELTGELAAATSFRDSLKRDMCEIAGVPEGSLGGSQAISNTSGIALHYLNLPLIDRCNLKKMSTEDGLETLCSLILLVSVREGLISIPDSITPRDFYHVEVTLPDTLPKDVLMELNQIQLEMKLGMESRKNSMKRLGKENIPETMDEIDKDMEKHSMFYGQASAEETEDVPQINSGVMNGSTPVEQVRKELTGQNGGGEAL